MGRQKPREGQLRSERNPVKEQLSSFRPQQRNNREWPQIMVLTTGISRETKQVVCFHERGKSPLQ